MRRLLFLVTLSVVLCVNLPSQPSTTYPPDPRWQTIGVGALAARPVTCVANRSVYICNGVGCATNGEYHYCTVANTWTIPSGSADAVLGKSTLTTVGAIPRVTAAGTLGESGISDDLTSLISSRTVIRGVNGTAGQGIAIKSGSATSGLGAATTIEAGTSASGVQGTFQIIDSFNGTATVNGVVCIVSSSTVADCSAGAAVGLVGVALTVSTPVRVAARGTSLLSIDNTTAVGDNICMSETVAGKGHSNGTVACPPGTGIGTVRSVTELSALGQATTALPMVTLGPIGANQGPTIQTWRKFSLVKIANGANGCTHDQGCWQINGVRGADATATLTQDVVLYQKPANGFIDAYSIKTAVVCSGATTALTGLGTATNNVLYHARNYNIAAAVAATNFSDTFSGYGRSTTAAENVVASLITTVEDVEDLVDGCAIDFWVAQGVLP